MLTATPTPVPGRGARDAVLDELRRAEYHRHDRSFLDSAWDWVADHLDRLFGNLNVPSFSVSTWAFWAVVAVAVAVVGYALWRAELPRRTGRRRGETLDLLAPDAGVDHRARARQFAADGRHAEALREWLRAAIATVEERGVLPARPGRTGAAVTREAGPRLPSAATALAGATRAFDEVWFGGRVALAGDVALGERAAELVLDARIVEAEPAEFPVPR